MTHLRWLSLGALAPLVGIALGCNGILSLGDYSIARLDASTDGTSVGEDAACIASDASSPGCYACTPTTTPQFLNACTNANCVPFDDKSRVTHLLPDGGLPPVPPVIIADAGGAETGTGDATTGDAAALDGGSE